MSHCAETQNKICFTLPLSPAVQSRSLRSVMEVYSIQPGYSVNRDVDVSSSPRSKLQLRPEYADMDRLHHNHSYRDREHHHSDPITGHAASVSWVSHHDKDRKWCKQLARIIPDFWLWQRCSFQPHIRCADRLQPTSLFCFYVAFSCAFIWIDLTTITDWNGNINHALTMQQHMQKIKLYRKHTKNCKIV